MEGVRSELCKRHNISWYQKCFLNDARTLWMCALNLEDWTYVEKLLEMFPTEIERELYELSSRLIYGQMDVNINFIRIVICTLSKSDNTYYIYRALDTMFNLFLFRDHQSVRHLYRFYQSCKPAIDQLLEKCQKISSSYYNIYLHIFIGNNLTQHLKSLFDVSKFSHTMRSDFCRFIYMCMIVNRCDVIENIYQTMKLVQYSPPPIYTIGLFRHSACVIQRRWRKYLARRDKQKVARLCYGIGISGNMAFVIYKHSGLENSYKKI